MEELILVICLFLGLTIAAIAVMWRLRSARFSVFEPGVFFAGTALVYSVLPLFSFLVRDLVSDPSSDARLLVLNPTAGDVALIGWFHFVFLSAFLLAYIGLRSKSGGIGVIPFRAGSLDLAILAGLYVASKAAFWLGKWYFDIPAAESYSQTYLQFSTLPLVAQQIMGHLQGISQIYAIVLCLALMSRKRYRGLVFVWLAIEAVLMLGNLGARTSFFALVLTSLIGYHYFVRRLKTIPLLGLLCLSLVGFLVVGALRDFSGASGGDDWIEGVLVRNEFISVYINALDIYRLKQGGMTDDVFPMQYIADLINFVPQQMLPFQKLDISRWYIETFYPEFAASGGGLVFGVIAESLAGGGWVDLILRGVFLGLACAYFHSKAAKLKGGFWFFAFYVWLIILAYRVFRTTTLYLFPLFVLDFLPALLAAQLLKYLMPTMFISRSSQPAGVSAQIHS